MNQHGANHYIFTTEAHIIPLMAKLRHKAWDAHPMDATKNQTVERRTQHELMNVERELVPVEMKARRSNESSVNTDPDEVSRGEWIILVPISSDV